MQQNSINYLCRKVATLRTNIAVKADWIEKTTNDMAKQDATITTLRKQLEDAREILSWIEKICDEELPLEYNDAMRKVFQRNIRDAALKGQP